MPNFFWLPTFFTDRLIGLSSLIRKYEELKCTAFGREPMKLSVEMKGIGRNLAALVISVPFFLSGCAAPAPSGHQGSTANYNDSSASGQAAGVAIQTLLGAVVQNMPHAISAYQNHKTLRHIEREQRRKRRHQAKENERKYRHELAKKELDKQNN
jgi:hypothetical protein